MLSSYKVKEKGSRERIELSEMQVITRYGETVDIGLLSMPFIAGCAISNEAGEIIAEIEKE